MSTIVVIPARYQSSRYPGKPLVDLDDGTKKQAAILWTYEAAQAITGVDRVYVATDDARIQRVAEARQAAVVMTSSNHRNGTERVAEAAVKIGAKPDDIIVNLQGDAPLTPPWFVSAIVDKLRQTPGADMVTPVLRCDADSWVRFMSEEIKGRAGATTAAFDREERALFFSKKTIPFLKIAEKIIPFLEAGKELTQGVKEELEQALVKTPVFHHAGVYAYHLKPLKDYPKWNMGPLENAEGLEQLRFMESGKGNIYVAKVDARGSEFWELNNPEDVPVIEGMMKRNAQIWKQSL